MSVIQKNNEGNEEVLIEKQEEKALRRFKQALNDLIILLRQSVGFETVSLYWINQDRRQFVLETKDTNCLNTIFQDRVSFENSFLDEYKSITEPITLQVGKHVSEVDLKHYYNNVPIRYIHLLPFINNNETVAITVLESKVGNISEEKDMAIEAYTNALGNMLHTFMQLSDLSEQQKEWITYEESVESLGSRLNNTQLLKRVINEMQKYLPKGGVSIIAHGMGKWSNIMNTAGAYNAPAIGMQLEENTIVHQALESGQPVFTIHFNSNPKRISAREPLSNGASLAIPLLLKDRRHFVILVYDENPLVFKESNKHKLINLARVAALKIATSYSPSHLLEDLITNEYEAFIPELFEEIIETELKQKTYRNNINTWYGFVTISNLSSIRTRLRLEELKKLQKDLVKELNPSNYGLSGLIGFHSDYVYSFIMQGEDENLVEEWAASLKEKYAEPYETENKQAVQISLSFGYTCLHDDMKDVQQVQREAKSALSSAVKNEDNPIYKF